MYPKQSAYDILVLYKDFSTAYTKLYSHPLQINEQQLIIQTDVYSSEKNYYLENDLTLIEHTKLLLCISHYEEDLTWLNSITTPYIIASKTINRNTLYVPMNSGNEVSSYLLYIITYYNYLPEFTLFSHGHNEHWHQLYNMFYIIDNLDYKQHYMNINNYWVNDRNMSTNKYMEELKLIWNDLFLDEVSIKCNDFEHVIYNYNK